MEERATRRPLRSARARGSKGPKTKRAAAALLHKWCTWIRTETPGCLPAGWEAGSRCGQKNPHPLFRPTDAPKSNNSTHQSAWDWSVVALTRVVETRSAILATSTNGPKPCSPCRKISPSRTPLPTPPPLPGAPLALAFFELCDPAARPCTQTTLAVRNPIPTNPALKPMTTAIAIPLSEPTLEEYVCQVGAPALYSLARTFDVLLRE